MDPWNIFPHRKASVSEHTVNIVHRNSCSSKVPVMSWLLLSATEELVLSSAKQHRATAVATYVLRSNDGKFVLYKVILIICDGSWRLE